VYLHDGDETRIEIVGFGLPRVENFDGKGAPRNGEDGTGAEVGAELFGVEGGRGDDEMYLIVFEADGVAYLLTEDAAV